MKRFKHSQQPVRHAKITIGELIKAKARKGNPNAQKFIEKVKEDLVDNE